MSRLTDRPFPPYTYIPGEHPHPHREPEGHSFGQPEPQVERFDPNLWAECEEFLFGCDLFNAGYYWEAHEQWEAVWHAVGRKGDVADFMKGLIKLAAAGVKLLEGRSVGVERHAKRASELFRSTAKVLPQLCGLDLSLLDEKACDLVGMNLSGLTDVGFQLKPRKE